MKSPIRIVKNRIGAAIAWRAEAAAERRVEDLSRTVHGLAGQMRDTVSGVAEWQARANETFSEVAMRLESLDHRTKEHEQLVKSLRDVTESHDHRTKEHEQLVKSLRDVTESLDHRTKEHEQLVKSLRDVTESLDHRTKEHEQMIQAVKLSSNDVRASLLVLESRIRAQPFNSELSPFEMNFEGFSTIGFAGAEDRTLADFSDLFRPDSEDLKIQLRNYTKWLPTSGVAIDLGCGRGEMVEVLVSEGLEAVGIDSDESMVDRCTALGLTAVHAEIGEYLASLADESVDVISAVHVVEHVGTAELESWLQEIARVLRPDGVFLAETPNPHAIDAFKAFWVDATHIRPYYPESLLHLAQVTGFSKALIWAEGDAANIQERLGLAGSYALIATK